MKKIIFLSFIFISFGVFAQNELTLQKCYELVNFTYPLAKQNALLTKKNEFDVSVIQKAKLNCNVFDWNTNRKNSCLWQ